MTYQASRTPIADRLAKLAAQRAGVSLAPLPQYRASTSQFASAPLWSVTVPGMPEFSARLSAHDVATRTAQGLSRTYGAAEVHDGQRVIAQYVRGQLIQWLG